MDVGDFAARKKVSKQAVLKAIKRGRLGASVTRDAQGRYNINPALGDVEWESKTDPARKPGNRDVGPDFYAAKARRETALAAMAEDELKRRRGDLVEAQGVEQALVGVFAQCRSRLLAIPTRAQAAMPELTHTQIVKIEDLVREALEDLTNPAAPKENTP